MNCRLKIKYYCQRVRPYEAADYRAVTSCVGGKNLINAQKCVM